MTKRVPGYTMRPLECIVVKPQSIPELAERLQVHRYTARRIVQRLAQEGYVVRNETTGVATTPRCA
jgi:DNA-binding IclR family transcriptional regulator